MLEYRLLSGSGAEVPHARAGKADWRSPQADAGWYGRLEAATWCGRPEPTGRCRRPCGGRAQATNSPLPLGMPRPTCRERLADEPRTVAAITRTVNAR